MICQTYLHLSQVIPELNGHWIMFFHSSGLDLGEPRFFSAGLIMWLQGNLLTRARSQPLEGSVPKGRIHHLTDKDLPSFMLHAPYVEARQQKSTHKSPRVNIPFSTFFSTAGHKAKQRPVLGQCRAFR